MQGQPVADDWAHERERRDAAYTEHETTWPLEAQLIPLNHRFAFYSGWDAAMKELGVRMRAPGQEPRDSETGRG